jgi:hypothetical protein
MPSPAALRRPLPGVTRRFKLDARRCERAVALPPPSKPLPPSVAPGGVRKRNALVVGERFGQARPRPSPCTRRPAAPASVPRVGAGVAAVTPAAAPSPPLLLASAARAEVDPAPGENSTRPRTCMPGGPALLGAGENGPAPAAPLEPTLPPAAAAAAAASGAARGAGLRMGGDGEVASGEMGVSDSRLAGTNAPVRGDDAEIPLPGKPTDSAPIRLVLPPPPPSRPPDRKPSPGLALPCNDVATRFCSELRSPPAEAPWGGGKGAWRSGGTLGRTAPAAPGSGASAHTPANAVSRDAAAPLRRWRPCCRPGGAPRPASAPRPTSSVRPGVAISERP